MWTNILDSNHCIFFLRLTCKNCKIYKQLNFLSYILKYEVTITKPKTYCPENYLPFKNELEVNIQTKLSRFKH